MGLLLIVIRLAKYYPKALLVFIGLTCLGLGHYFGQVNHLERIENSYQGQDSIKTYLKLTPLDLLDTGDKLRGQGQLLLASQTWMPVNLRIDKDQLDQGQVQTILSKEVCVPIIGSLETLQEPDNFYVFNYKAYQRNRGIVWTLKIEEMGQEFLEPKRIGSKFREIKIHSHKYLKDRSQHLWLALQNKLLFNIDSPEFKLVKGNLVNFAIIHFFAISGFHIQYLIKHLSYLFRRLGIDPNQLHYCLLPILAAYGWFISWPVGTVRAIGVYALKNVTKDLAWPLSSMDRLAITGILMLIYQPNLAMDLGFILSFLMTYLVKFYIATRGQANFSNFELALTCLLFSWPITMGLNHLWNPLQVFSVFLTGLFFDKVFMPMMIISFGLNLLSLPFLEKLILIGDKLLAKFPYWDFFFNFYDLFNVGVRQASACLMLAMVGLGITWLYFLSKDQTRKAYKYLLVFYALFVFIQIGPRFYSRITIIDVDQGDAILIQPAFSYENWLVDTGGKVGVKQADKLIQEEKSRKFAQYTIIDALEALGVRKIHQLILTHDDMDHIGNFKYLAEKIKIKNLYLNDLSLAKLKELGVEMNQCSRIYLPNKPVKLQAGQGQMWLTAVADKDETESNSLSIIQILRISTISGLLMADLPQELEGRVTDLINNQRVDLVKLGHHGSKTSSSEEFLRISQPKIALISAGENNSYGHPSTEVLQRLERLKINYLSSHEVGAIQLIIHPFTKNIEIRTAK